MGANFVRVDRSLSVDRFSLALAVGAMCADRASNGSGAARRRRERRLRTHWRREQLTKRMLLASLAHHSAQKMPAATQAATYADAYTQTETVAEYSAPAPAVYTTSATAVHAAPAPVSTCDRVRGTRTRDHSPGTSRANRPGCAQMQIFEKIVEIPEVPPALQLAQDIQTSETLCAMLSTK